MALTESQQTPLGSTAPNFSLKNPVTQKTENLDQHRGKVATLVMFICNHCPYVKHVQKGLSALAGDLMSDEIGFIAINSNDVENYPDDHPNKMAEWVQQDQVPFPYLFDETQAIAKAYGAACTPDFFLFNHDLKLVYRGQMDNSRPGNGIPVTGNDLRLAIQSLKEGKSVNPNQRPSIGCNIKWKSS